MKVAFVGCGGIARGYHAPAFAKVEGFQIVAACDIVEERARQLAEPYGARVYTDIEKMLAEEDIDIVDVVTRENDRPPLLIKALEAGKHVFCEKPLAGRRGQYNVRGDDLEESKKVIDAWRKAGTFFGISFNYRFAPHTRLMKQVIDSGEAGEPVLINVFANLNCWSHVIDLMRWFNGEVVELTGYASGPENEPDRCASLKFENGSVGALVGSNRLGWNHELLRIEWVGTRERLVVTDLVGMFERYPIGHTDPVTVWRQPIAAWRNEFNQTFERSVTAYATAVKEGKTPPVTGTDAFREIEIDAGILMSAERGGERIRIEHY